MEEPERRAGRGARIAVTVLVLAGVIGATTVFLVSGAIRRSDRRAVAAWERHAAPITQRLESLASALPEAFRTRAPRGAHPRSVPQDLTTLRTGIETARRQLFDVRAPEVIETVLTLYANGIASALSAVTALEQISLDPSRRSDLAVEFGRARERSLVLFGRARAALQRLHRRVGLPA